MWVLSYLTFSHLLTTTNQPEGVSNTQVSTINRCALSGLLSQMSLHDGCIITYRCRHLSPLQNHILGDPSIRVYINPLIFIAHQKLHSIRVGENNDCMGFDATLNLENRNKEACL